MTMARILSSMAAMAISTAMATAGEPLKTWDYSPLKDVHLSCGDGNSASMQVCRDLKTPEGGAVLELSLKELNPEAKPWSVQLNFVYSEGLKKGHCYELSFLCKGSVGGEWQSLAALSGSPWTELPGSSGLFEVSKGWRLFKMNFSAKEDIYSPVSVPRIMLAGYGSSAKLYFGPATLMDLADAPEAASKGNLVFNSGFELGDAGFNLVRYLHPSTNPEMKYEAPESDGTTCASGARSLKITNAFAEEAKLHPRELLLAPGTEYTLSMWLKADRPDIQVNVSLCSATAQANAAWTGHSASFSTNTEWKRFSHSFKTNANPAFSPYLMSIGFNSKATLWIDDLQLDNGALKPYGEGVGLESACLPADNFLISDDGHAKAIVTVKAANFLKRPVDARLYVSATDDYSGELAFSTLLDMALNAGEAKASKIEIPLSAYGSYIIDSKLVAKDIEFRSQAACVGVIGRYETHPIDLDKTFCVGFNGPGGNFFSKLFTNKPGAFRAMGCGQEEYARRLEMMGCRLLRDWCAPPTTMFSWQLNEPEEGRYDFRHADRGVSLFGRHGIALLPVLDPGFTYGEKEPEWKYPEPEWMRQMRKGGEHVSGAGDYSNALDCRIVPMEKWRRFVSAMASHFKGRISHYEIVNEPNLFCPSAKIYVDFLKASSEEIRKADPSAKVVGFCSTGDKGGNVEKFLGECFELGGLGYADAVSWHPYFARELSSALPADRQIENIKALAAKYGKGGVPLWNTENFFLYGTWFEGLPPYKPHHAARRFLTDLGEGVAQSMPVEDRTVWKDMLTPNFKWRIGVLEAFQMMPSSNYVCYNALARLFEGAKPIGKYRWQGKVVCYAFERKGELLAAFWNYSGKENFIVSMPEGGEVFQILDMFGNRSTGEGRGFKVDFAPCYMKWSGRSAEAFLKELGGSTLTKN